MRLVQVKMECIDCLGVLDAFWSVAVVLVSLEVRKSRYWRTPETASRESWMAVASYHYATPVGCELLCYPRMAVSQSITPAVACCISSVFGHHCFTH